MATDGLHFEGAVFDLDGVITFTASAHAASWKRMFDAFLRRRADSAGVAFVPFDEASDYRTYVDGKPRIEGVKSFLRSRGIDLPEGTPDDPPSDQTAWGLGNRKNEAFREVLDAQGVEVDEEAVSLVRSLRQRGIRVAVASSSKNCGPILERAGLDDLFEARVDGVVSEDLGLSGKPNPDIFVEAARRIGVSPHATVVIEDAISGVQAGRAGEFGLVLGVDRLGVATALREHGADVVLEGFPAGTLDLIDAWFAQRDERRPAALAHWDDVQREFLDKTIVLFLDYDGTLTPIVDRPDDAVLDDERRAVLRRVSERFTTAIISGRGREDVARLVGLDSLAYAGSHGFDIIGPNRTQIGHQVAPWVEPTMQRIHAALRTALADVEGALLEPKRYSIAVHYRLVREEHVPIVERAVDCIVDEDPRLKKAHGKKVFEIRPDIDWDKGKALLFLLEALGLDRPDVVPVYIGDDVTDEDAFRELVDRGVGFLVSDVPKVTHARYWLQAPWEVYALFEKLLAWKDGSR